MWTSLQVPILSYIIFSLGKQTLVKSFCKHILYPSILALLLLLKSFILNKFSFFTVHTCEDVPKQNMWCEWGCVGVKGKELCLWHTKWKRES